MIEHRAVVCYPFPPLFQHTRAMQDATQKSAQGVEEAAHLAGHLGDSGVEIYLLGYLHIAAKGTSKTSQIFFPPQLLLQEQQIN